ncbi:MAG: hypothetical protein M3541_19790, partial [Acidobacteriota bacterium]|nr:hypothetical protein [Acidobacteriota bacterium]
TITDLSGQTVVTLSGPAERGVNRVLWNMRRASPGGGRGGGGGGGAALLPAGDYRVTVAVGSLQQTGVGRIRDRAR